MVMPALLAATVPETSNPLGIALPLGLDMTGAEGTFGTLFDLVVPAGVELCVIPDDIPDEDKPGVKPLGRLSGLTVLPPVKPEPTETSLVSLRLAIAAPADKTAAAAAVTPTPNKGFKAKALAIPAKIADAFKAL